MFARGYTNIITIGNDSPHLTARRITEAQKRLDKSPLVLGPSADGGFYLMGLRKSYFNRQTFLRLPWKTGALSSSIIRFINSKNIEVSLLETLTDLDTQRDIKILLNDSRSLSSSVFLALRTALKTLTATSLKQPFFLDLFLQRSYFNKASPAFY